MLSTPRRGSGAASFALGRRAHFRSYWIDRLGDSVRKSDGKTAPLDCVGVSITVPAQAPAADGEVEVSGDGGRVRQRRLDLHSGRVGASVPLMATTWNPAASVLALTTASMPALNGVPLPTRAAPSAFSSVLGLVVIF